MYIHTVKDSVMSLVLYSSDHLAKILQGKVESTIISCLQ